jgi:glutathione S-transferase
MKVIGSLTSPFTRIVRVVCEELGITYEHEVTPPFGKLDEQQDRFIRSHNPLMKVPILVNDKAEIFDSRVIVQYLLKQKHEKSDFRTDFPENLAEDNLVTVIYGVIEAGVLRFSITTMHPEINAGGGFVQRSLNRIDSGLKWLEQQPISRQSFGVPEVALICGLEWFRKRNVYDWERFPNLTATYRTFCGRPSLVKTQIPDTL